MHEQVMDLELAPPTREMWNSSFLIALWPASQTNPFPTGSCK